MTYGRFGDNSNPEDKDGNQMNDMPTYGDPLMSAADKGEMMKHWTRDPKKDFLGGDDWGDKRYRPYTYQPQPPDDHNWCYCSTAKKEQQTAHLVHT